MKTEKYTVTGMTCSACSAHVEKSVCGVEGVEKAEVNLLTNSMTVTYDESKTGSGEIVKAVESGGYGASPQSSGENSKSVSAEKGISEVEKHIADMKKRLIISIIFTVPLFYISMGHMMGFPLPSFFHSVNNAMTFAFTQFILCIPVVFVNFHYFKNGFRSLFKGAPNMDSLIAIGSGASVLYGIYAIYKISYGFSVSDYGIIEQYSMDLYFESAAMILTLISLGKLLEARAKGKTSQAISRLISLAPKTACVERDGEEKIISADEIAVGDILIVRSGEAIPADGVIISGNGSVDESAITGESMPADKEPGDKVTGATINKSGYFKMKASKVGEDTALSQIIKLVEEASSSKAPIAKLADKVSRIFVPAVITIAVAAVIIWLLSGAEFEFAMSIGISVLVISCPCALGLATPTAIMVGTGKGAELGILIKSAEALETAHSIKNIALDKTGTITEGKPVVTDIIINSNLKADADEFLGICAAVEKLSEHPLAGAVLLEAKERNIVIPDAEGYTQKAGRGISALVGARRIYGGNGAYMEELGVFEEVSKAKARSLAEMGKTPLFFADDNTIIGIIAVSDTIKPTSPAAIEEFKSMGISTMMLTGDNETTAKAIASQAGVTEFSAGVLPQDKERVVSSLKEKGVTAMIGDGINDAPALAAADVGIAIGAGTDIAIESADIVLMKGDLNEAVAAVKLSKAVIRNIKENLFWALIYNAVCIPVAAGLFYNVFGLKLNPMIAAGAMSLSSVCVVMNALRLKFFKNSKILPSGNKNSGEKPKAAVSSIDIEIKGGKTKMEKKMLIEGMSCGHCSARVEKALNELEGVSAKVDLEKKTAFVTLTQDVSNEVLTKAVTDAGYEVVSIAG